MTDTPITQNELIDEVESLQEDLNSLSLTDIAIAGSNIDFEPDATKDYTVVGTGCSVNAAGIASGFATGSYLTKTGLWSSVNGATKFEYKTKFKLNSNNASNYLASVDGTNYSFGIYVNNNFRISVWLTYINTSNESTYKSIKSADNVVTTSTDYWLKVVADASLGNIDVLLSTDGVTYTLIAQEAGTFSSMVSTTYTDLLLGTFIDAGQWDLEMPLDGTIDLSQTSVKVSDVDIWKAFVLNSNAIQINADLSVLSNYLQNTSTYANAIDINNSAANSKQRSVTLGVNAVPAQNGVSIGYQAGGGGTSVSVGRHAGSAIATNSFIVSIGAYANCNDSGRGVEDKANIGASSVAVGAESSSAGANGIAIGPGAWAGFTSLTQFNDPSFTPTLNNIAIGPYAHASGVGAIQIGGGSNSTARTLSIGFPYVDAQTPAVNYTLLDSAGIIPSARMPSDVLKNATTQTNGLAILGTTTAAANATAIGKDSLASYITTAVGTSSQSYGIMSTSVGAWSNAGNSANVVSAIAIGAGASALASGAILLGNGINNEAKTFKVALTDTQTVHAATDEASGLFTLLDSSGKIPGGRMALQGSAAPTTSTVGSIGQFYVDTTNQVGYMCVSDASSTYVWKQITA